MTSFLRGSKRVTIMKVFDDFQSMKRVRDKRIRKL